MQTPQHSFYLNSVSGTDLNYTIEGLKAGDEKIIQFLYDAHYKALCYMIDRLINNKEEAEDIATETFLKLLRKRLDFDNYHEVKSFLFTAAKNASIDYLRKMKRKESAIGELTYLACPEESFGSTEMLTAKVLQALLLDIEALPDQCRKIFKSLFFEHKTTDDIAVSMNISPQTVLNQKNKAVRTLRMGLLKKGILSFCIITIF